MEWSKRRPRAICQARPIVSNGGVSGSWRGSYTYLQQIPLFTGRGATCLDQDPDFAQSLAITWPP